MSGRVRRCAAGATIALGIGLLGSGLEGQGIPRDQRVFNEDELRPSGQHVIPAFDGWFENEDGTRTMCFSYFSLNTEEEVDVPLGPSNRIEPERFDGAQPSHFDPVPDPELTEPYRHHWCVFTVTVPADFDEEVVWTLVTRGDELSAPGKIIAPYILEEPSSPGRGQIAPVVRLREDGPSARGRRGIAGASYSTEVGEDLPMTVWVEHPEPGTWLGWTKHQGPGPVSFSRSEVRTEGTEGPTTVTARFGEPGRYRIRVQAINDTENHETNPTYGFEFHCCWTNAFLDVEVKGSPSSEDR